MTEDEMVRWSEPRHPPLGSGDPKASEFNENYKDVKRERRLGPI